MRDRTELIIILDRSGSMEKHRSDHEGGLRSFVRDQRQLPGDVRLTFVRFDSHDPFELVLDGIQIEQVQEDDLTLVPRGGTPLLDAIGRTITHVAGRLKEVDPPPDQIVVMIITDGEENASREYTKEKIKALIAEKETGGWKVLYLGANVDEFSEAEKIGVALGASMGYTGSPAGIQAMYACLSSNTLNARCATQSGLSAGEAYGNYTFTSDQRAAAKSDGFLEFLSRTSTKSSSSDDAKGGAACNPTS